MFALLGNISSLLVLVAGLLVAALAIPDAKWKRRAIIATLCLGAAHSIITVVVFENTPGNPRPVSEAGVWFLGQLNDLVASKIFIALAFLIAGAALGFNKQRLTQRIWPKPKQGFGVALERLRWPIVSEWLAPFDALDRYVNSDTLKKVSDAIRIHKELTAQSEAELAKHQKPNPSDVFIGLNLSNDTALQEVLNKKRDSEINVILARNAAFDELRRQLQEGSLVGRAVLIRPDKISEEWEYLRPASWVTLEFDESDYKCETVRAGKHTYKGLRIGKHEATH